MVSTGAEAPNRAEQNRTGCRKEKEARNETKNEKKTELTGQQRR
jgi:gas vesicle protein